MAADEDLLGRRAFVLDVWGYRVLKASTSREVLDRLDGVYCLVIDLPLDRVDFDRIMRVKEMWPELRAVVVSPYAGYVETAADAYLPEGLNSVAEILERVRLLTRRKRGPRKGEAKKPPSRVGMEEFLDGLARAARA